MIVSFDALNYRDPWAAYSTRETLTGTKTFDAEDCDTCAEDGMLGAMAGWTGSFAAMQAIRVLLAGVSSFGDPGYGKLHMLDGLKPGMRTLAISKDPGCKGCG